MVEMFGLLINLACLYVGWRQLQIAQKKLPDERQRSEASVNPLASRLRMYWPVALCFLLGASAWIPYYLINAQDIPEWPESRNPFIKSYSGGNGECLVVADGGRFRRYAGKYKLAAACFAYTGLGDILDTPQLQVSASSDIRADEIPLRTIWGPLFERHIQDLHAGGLTHVLLLLPNGVSSGQFATLREAKRLGVRIIGVGGNTFSPHAP
jgi:hypothetical protein